MLRYIKVGVYFLMILRRSSHAPRAIKCDGLKDSMGEAKGSAEKSRYLQDPHQVLSFSVPITLLVDHGEKGR